MIRSAWKKILICKITVLLGLVIGTLELQAAGDAPLLSLNNTDFVVTLAFLAFFAILFYLKVPSIISKFLDGRASAIKQEIDNANAILEESKSLLADLEREHKQNIERAEQIILDAEAESRKLLDDSKKEIRLAIERKVKAAEEQIRATESAVVKSIKDQAVEKSFHIAEKKISEISKTKGNLNLIDKSISSLKDHL